MALIAAHNAEAANGLHTFEIGLNQYADMTDKEFFATMNGFAMDGKTASSSGMLYKPRYSARRFLIVAALCNLTVKLSHPNGKY